MRPSRAFAAASALVVTLAGAAATAPVEIKIATLAPHGSAWANIMKEGSARLRAETEGRVQITTYFSGQQGDERDVVRKMKLGQLDGAALTAVGLGLIVPDILVLQLPYLFTDDRQIDHVRARLGADFERRFEAAGYVLVSWGDVGWVHTYSTVKLDTREALTAARMWVWIDDPIVREYFALIGVNGVPLGLPEVLPALQNGSIQAVYGPPLAVLALQWYTKVKYVTDRPSGYGIGALVIRKPVFDRLSGEDRQRLLAGGRDTGHRLVATVRRDNERAKAAMAKAGIVTVRVPDDAHAALGIAARMVWARLARKLYPQALLDQVLATIAETP